MIHLILIVLIQIEVVWNWYLIEKRKRKIAHGWRSLMRIAIASCLLLFLNLPVLTGTLYASALFWLLFDIELNLLRGKPFGYMGTGSLLDRQFRKVNPYALLGYKLVILLLTLGLFYGW